MLTVGEAFHKFKSRLEITEGEQQSASTRQRKLRAQVEEGISVAHDFLIGAYARDTKTKPLRDVDILVELSEEERTYLKKPPTEVLTAVKAILAPHYGETRVIIDRFCVRVDFGTPLVNEEDILSFDVVPAFTDGVAYTIPDDRKSTWIGTRPDVHATMATETNKALSGNWKPAVKMIKKWNQEHGQPVEPSFLLEVMALKLFHPPWGGSFPYEIKQYFASAADRLSEGWPDPAGVGPDVSDVLDEDPLLMIAAEKALREAEAACSEAIRLERAGNTGAALSEWQRLFGSTFAKS